MDASLESIWIPEALAIAKERLRPFEDRSCLINGNFAEMDVLLGGSARFHAVDGVLLDIGRIIATT